MAEYRLSKLAAEDLAAIADYTIEQFGLDQAYDYWDSLTTCFSDLAEHPSWGRPAEELAPGLRRFTLQSHEIFYLPHRLGILIVRILHESRDMPRHFMS